jgi:tRNA-Thr(GGU) m(6)t(6)A37 methyltransferase TsaA
MAMELTYRPIGVIRTPFKEPRGTPIQPTGAMGVEGTVEVFPEYSPGLRDLECFSHVILLYHFHLAEGRSLTVKPYMDGDLRDVFATRFPGRPNLIGLSIVRLKGIEGSILRIMDVDIVDGTPLLDIKPYVPAFDRREGVRIGWLKDRVGDVSRTRSDSRTV